LENPEHTESLMKGIPILHMEGDCIARAWELSLIELHQKGCTLKTEYDKPENPPGKDATITITITDPSICMRFAGRKGRSFRAHLFHILCICSGAL
jgi:hypothetical protein